MHQPTFFWWQARFWNMLMEQKKKVGKQMRSLFFLNQPDAQSFHQFRTKYSVCKSQGHLSLEPRALSKIFACY